MSEKDLIIKCNIMLKAKEINEVRESILEQMKDGVVILPPGFELAEVDVRLLEELKRKVHTYYLDCSLGISENDETCQRCNKNTFASIIEMIDEYISELKGEQE